MQRVINRCLGILSLALALVCLYLALSLLAEKLLSHELKEKLAKANIQSDTALIKWSGKGLCAYQLRMRLPQQQVQAEIQTLCTELNLRTQWPFVGLGQVSVNHAQVWIKAIHSSRHHQEVTRPKRFGQDVLASSFANQSKHWSTIEAVLQQVQSIAQTTQGLWHNIQQALTKLKNYELSLNHIVLRIDLNNPKRSTAHSSYRQAKHQSPVVIGLDAELNHLGGEISFHSALTQQRSKVRIRPYSLELQSDLALNLEALANQSPNNMLSRVKDFTVNKGGRILFKKQELVLGGDISFIPQATFIPSVTKPIKMQIKGLLSSAIQNRSHHKQSQQKVDILNFTARFLTADSASSHSASSNYIQAVGNLTDQTLSEFSVNWNDLNLDSSFAHQIPSLFQLKALSSGKIKFLPKLIDVETQLRSLSLATSVLPTLNWPFASIKTHFKSSYFSEHRPSRDFGNLAFDQFHIALQGHQGHLVHADLDLQSSERFLTQLIDLGPKDVLNSDFNLDLNLKVEKTSCQNLYDLLPPALLGPIGQTELSGFAKPHIQLRYRSKVNPHKQDHNKEHTAKKISAPLKLKIKNLLRRCRFEKMDLSALEKKSVYQHNRRYRIQGVEWLDEDFSYMIDPKFSEGKKIKVGPETKDFIPISELPSYIGGAMYLTEETGFWRGGAFSLALLNRALNTNLREGRFVYGGSTITQQLVKNLFLDRDKTMTRKIREALISARIIDQVSKRRVLELYLNMIEFGPQVFGIQAAAQYYFQKDARNLSPEEAIFLAMLKVSPKRGQAWKKRGYSPKFTWWKKRMVEVFERLVKEGLISEERAQNAAPFILKWNDGLYQGYERLYEARP